MKNTKEIKTILSAIYSINRTNGKEDKDISNLIKYAFNRCIDGNFNYLTLFLINKTKSEIIPELKQILKEDTKYFDYMEETNEGI